MNASALLHQLAGIVRRDLQTRWQTRTDPDGRGWARNAASTIRRKGFDDPMRETGATLAGSMPVLAETPASITLGFPEGPEHDKVVWNATTNERTGAPARVLMGVSEEAMTQMQDAAVDWIVEAFDGATVG